MMQTEITWDETRRHGKTPAGHRIFVLHKAGTTDRAIKVIYPPGGEITETWVVCESDDVIEQEALRLVGLPS